MRRVLSGACALLALVATRAPRLAFALADLLAWLTLGAARRRSRGELAGAQLRRFWSNKLRGLVLDRCIRRFGSGVLRRIEIRSDALASLARPCILATMHAGPIHAFSAVLDRLGSALVLRERPLRRGPSNITIADTGGDGDARAFGIVRGVRWLRDGGYVFLALDPLEATWMSVPFRGKTLRLARGAFAIARMSGAPIVPVVARWNGAAIDVDAGDPIRGDDEQALADGVGQWFASYLDAHRGEISQRTLHLLS